MDNVRTLTQQLIRMFHIICGLANSYVLHPFLSFTQDTAELEQLIVEDKSHGKMPLIVFGIAGRWGVNEPCVFLNGLMSDLHKHMHMHVLLVLHMHMWW